MKNVKNPRFIIIIYTISADTAPSDTLKPSLNPFVIDLLTDSRPEGPKGMEAENPTKKANNIAPNIEFGIDNNCNILFSF